MGVVDGETRTPPERVNWEPFPWEKVHLYRVPILASVTAHRHSGASPEGYDA